MKLNICFNSEHWISNEYQNKKKKSASYILKVVIMNIVNKTSGQIFSLRQPDYREF